MTLTAKIGFGPKVEGELVFLSDPSSHWLNADMAGKIVVSLSWVSREFLEKASLLGVSGLIAASIHFRDYQYFLKQSDFSLIILEKFGKLDLSSELKAKLEKLAGKKGILDGEAKTLTV